MADRATRLADITINEGTSVDTTTGRAIIETLPFTDPSNPNGIKIKYSGVAPGIAAVAANEKIALIILFAGSGGVATFQVAGEAVVTVPASQGVGIAYELKEAESAQVTFAGTVASWAVGVFSA